MKNTGYFWYQEFPTTPKTVVLEVQKGKLPDCTKCLPFLPGRTGKLRLLYVDTVVGIPYDSRFVCVFQADEIDFK